MKEFGLRGRVPGAPLGSANEYYSIMHTLISLLLHSMSYYIVQIWSGKPGKWEGILQSGKSHGILNRLERSGKIRHYTGKIRGFQTNDIFYFSDIYMNCVLFAKIDRIFS